MSFHITVSSTNTIADFHFLTEDEDEAAHIQAKDGLELYTYSLCGSLSDVKAKLPDKSSEIAALETKLEETVKWLEASQQAGTEEYEERRKEIEEASTPLMKAFYEQGGAAGGATGGFPCAEAAGGARGRPQHRGGRLSTFAPFSLPSYICLCLSFPVDPKMCTTNMTFALLIDFL